MKSKIWFLGIGIITGLALLLAGWKVWDGAYAYHGAMINPPAPEAEIQLNDQNGQPFLLSAQRGKVVLLFFGYTHCTDVCPVTLSVMKQVKQRLGSLSSQVEVVFITVDPERDSPAVLRSYLSTFDPSFVGLTGDQSSLEAVWRNYGVYRQKVVTGDANQYEMDHTSHVYVIDPHGNWMMDYPFGTEASAITQDLIHLLRNQ